MPDVAALATTLPDHKASTHAGTDAAHGKQAAHRSRNVSVSLGDAMGAATGDRARGRDSDEHLRSSALTVRNQGERTAVLDHLAARDDDLDDNDTALDPASAGADIDSGTTARDLPLPRAWTRASDDRAERGGGADTWRAGVLGFCLGTLVVAPLVISATTDTAPWHLADTPSSETLTLTGQPRVASPATRAASGRLADMAQMAGTTALPEPQALISSLRVGPLAPLAGRNADVQARQNDRVAMEAKQLIADGDIAAARTLLRSQRVGGGAQSLFALAETYDPNVLSSWGETTAAPDAEEARGLYMLALMAGVAEAQKRLDALPRRP